MEKEKPLLESGVRVVDRPIEPSNPKKPKVVIETFEECLISFANQEIVRRYSIHWLFDREKLTIKYYEKFGCDDVLGIFTKVNIPNDLWKKMKKRAYDFLETEQVKRALTDEIILTFNQDETEVTAKFKGRRWSGYILVYERAEDGSLELIDSRNRRKAKGEKARRGHSRVPRLLCERTYDFVLDHFKGLPKKTPTQEVLELRSPSGESCDD